jgi:hypothetical protein
MISLLVSTSLMGMIKKLNLITEIYLFYLPGIKSSCLYLRFVLLQGLRQSR